MIIHVIIYFPDRSAMDLRQQPTPLKEQVIMEEKEEEEEEKPKADLLTVDNTKPVEADKDKGPPKTPNKLKGSVKKALPVKKK